MKHFLKIMMTLLLIGAASSACAGGGTQNAALDATQVALSVQNTLAAQQFQENAQSTMAALAAQTTAMTAQLTQRAAAAPPAAPPTQPPPPAAPPTEAPTAALPPASPTPTPPPVTRTPSISFEDWQKSANILLYEDIAGLPGIVRYVSKALDGLKLAYKDLGSSKGILGENLTSGAPGGKPWDLIIIAAESRGDPSGQYFEAIQQALTGGSAVILEIWYLNVGSHEKADSLFGQCGLMFQGDYTGKPSQPLDLVIYPVNGVAHPLLSQPNSGIRFSNVHAQWPDSRDFGDWMQLTGYGDAQILLGSSQKDPTGRGVLSVCHDGRFILQTFSTHNLAMDSAVPLWQNYIFNALQARWRSSQ